MKQNGNNEKQGNWYLGLDVGTSSCGWAVTDQDYNILKFKGKSMWGARLFDEANTAEARRTARTNRRRLNRRKQRLLLLESIFTDEITKLDPNFFVRLHESNLWAEDRTESGCKYTLFNDPGFTDVDYLKKYPVYDTEGKPVAVNENETAVVLIVPEFYRNEKGKIVNFYKNSQINHREVDVDSYGLDPKLPKQQELKIIWAASGQKVFTFDPEINDSGKINIPIITVLTENNSYVCQRQGILGNANTDPCKILLDEKSSENTYKELQPELRKLGIDDNLKAIVSINEKAEEEQALTRSNLRLSLITMLVFLVLAIFLIYQSSALVFAENKVRYTIMSVFGIRWTHIYKSYLLLKTGALALICIALGFIDRYSSRLYLMVAFIFLIAVQYLIIYMCTDRLQRKNTASVLKGE